MWIISSSTTMALQHKILNSFRKIIHYVILSIYITYDKKK